MAHLLFLSTLHAAAPGVLDVIFGADGDFEGAPQWTGPLVCMSAGRFVSGAASMHIRMGGRHQPSNLVCASFRGDDAGLLWSYPLRDLALDCRIPSVAVRLAGLCKRAAGRNLSLAEDGCIAAAFYAHFEAWTATDAARLASLTLALAPRIAALGGPRG